MTTHLSHSSDYVGLTPFDDTGKSRLPNRKLVIPTNGDYVATGIDTKAIDPFRQGVEITDNRYRFEGMSPKLWAGNLEHEVEVITYGQGNSFVDRTFTTLFNDEKTDYLTTFIADGENISLDFPIELNGMAEATEGTIEPLTIPYKKASTESPNYLARSVKGALDEGNEGNGLGYGFNRICQFIEYKPAKVVRPFLDEGQNFIYTGKGPRLNLDFDPVALFLLDGNLEDSGPNHIELVYDPGINNVPGPVYNRFSTPTATLSSSAYEQIISPPNSYIHSQDTITTNPNFALHLTGNLSFECFVEANGLGSNLYPLSFGTFNPDTSNELYGLTILVGTNKMQFAFQNRFLEFSFLASQWNNTGMNHVVGTKEIISGGTQLRFRMYLNGSLLGTNTIASVILVDSSQCTFNIGGAAIGLTTPGSIASVKIFDKVLTQTQVTSEYQRMLKDEMTNTGIPISLGYLSTERTVQQPYNDTENEAIVNQVNTTSAPLKAVLEALDINLDEDIRGTFDVKSAPAGFDVYGANSAIYGTDSIAYRGKFRR